MQPSTNIILPSICFQKEPRNFSHLQHSFTVTIRGLYWINCDRRSVLRFVHNFFERSGPSIVFAIGCSDARSAACTHTVDATIVQCGQSRPNEPPTNTVEGQVGPHLQAASWTAPKKWLHQKQLVRREILWKACSLSFYEGQHQGSSTPSQEPAVGEEE